MKIRNLPSIILDETVASWLYRCAYSSSCDILTTIDLEEFWIKINDKGRLVGFDFDLSNEKARRVITRYNLTEQAVQRLFSPDRVALDPDYRFAYCPACLNEDVAFVGLPAWRRSWCYIYSPFCIRHRRLLLIAGSCRDIEKSHLAFLSNCTEECSNDNGYYNFGAERCQLPKNSIRNHLAIRVQMWIEKNIKTCSDPLVLGSVRAMAEERLHSIDVLMRYLLRPKSFRFPPGPARYFFTSTKNAKWPGDPSFTELQAAGVRRSTPYQRMTALIFVGYIFGLFRAREVDWLRRFSYGEGFYWPESIKEVGKIIFPFQTKKSAAAFVRSLVHDQSSKEVIDILAPLLVGAISWAKKSEGFWQEWYEL